MLMKEVGNEHYTAHTI